MRALSTRIDRIITDTRQIPLRNGNTYRYVGPATTRVNGILNEFAFEYEISHQNHKRVTIGLINTMYEQIQRTGIMPTKAEMSYKAPTIRSIEMLVKQDAKGMSVVRKACSLHCWSSSVGTWICLLAQKREAENLRGIGRWI
jgi:hypothetical protein